MLSYGGAREAPPERRLIAPRAPRRGRRRGPRPAPAPGDRVRRRGAADLEVDADPDQLFRVLINLVRNALQALERRPRPGAGAAAHDLGRCAAARSTVIRVDDTGPGVPARAREHLFQAFQGRRGPAAPASASPSPPNWSAPTAAASLVDRAGPGARFEVTLPDRQQSDGRNGG